MDLSLLTYNIRIGTFNPFGLEGVARVIERLRPDIAGLQEVHVYANASGPVDQPRWLAERLNYEAVFGAARDVPPQIVPGQIGQFGNALLSRFPVIATETHLLPRPSEDDEQRAVLATRLETPAGQLNVFVTHWSLLPEHRAEQVVATLNLIEQWSGGGPSVLMGDFNALPDAPEIAALREHLTDLWEATATPLEARISFPAGPKGTITPNGWTAALDYIFTSRDITPRKIEVIYDETLASDHNPVLATIQSGV